VSSQASFIADGQQVLAPDLNSLSQSAAVLTGSAIAALVGASDANAGDVPLTVTPGTGMTIVVGGPGQKVLVQSRFADYIPATTYPIAAASSAARIDLVAFAYADVIVPSGGTASFMDSQGNLGPQPTSYVYRGIQVVVVTGSPNGGVPAAPSGFDPLAQVAVPAGSTSIAASQITVGLSALPSLVGAAGLPILPIYNAAGASMGDRMFAAGTNLFPVVAASISSPIQTITLAGKAAFTSQSSYLILTSLDLTNLPGPGSNTSAATFTVIPVRLSGTQFTLELTYSLATLSIGSPVTAGSVNVDWLCVGY